ncbi:MAG: glycosyltransferase family 2 protein [Candidatus Omnitrophica bacterium]|nr:glycosyltransferase family 2 protein [Candidatus Omnitrophota bacterium]
MPFSREIDSPQVSVIMAAYNEAPFIETVLRRVSAVPLDKEIIVVDDGSTDQTAAILARLEQELPIQVVRHPQNRGKGQAIQSALARSRGQIMLVQDADLEYDPEDYPALLKPLLEGQTTVVYGSRFLGAHRASSFGHRVGNWIITSLVNVLFHASLTDVETGYKAFRREVVDALSVRVSRFGFEVEFTCKAIRQGHTIFEIPVSYYGRSYAEGKKITWRDGVYALWVIFCCKLDPWY